MPYHTLSPEQSIERILEAKGISFNKFTGAYGKYDANDANPEFIATLRNCLDEAGVTYQATEMGKVVETAVYKHVAAFYYQQATSVGYFRGGRKNKEIDIVVEYPKTNNILIEVKYREGAPIADDDAISELSEKASAAIVITKNADDFGVHHTQNGRDMIRIPAFAFLYLLGHAEKSGYRIIE